MFLFFQWLVILAFFDILWSQLKTFILPIFTHKVKNSLWKFEIGIGCSYEVSKILTRKIKKIYMNFLFWLVKSCIFILFSSSNTQFYESRTFCLLFENFFQINVLNQYQNTPKNANITKRKNILQHLNLGKLIFFPYLMNRLIWQDKSRKLIWICNLTWKIKKINSNMRFWQEKSIRLIWICNFDWKNQEN